MPGGTWPEDEMVFEGEEQPQFWRDHKAIVFGLFSGMDRLLRP